MAVRIQLASNFQVVELSYENWDKVNIDEVEDATRLCNQLGRAVINDIKTAKPVEKKEEMATASQISYLVGLGMTQAEAKKMTKKEAWKFINENKDN